MDPTLAAVLGGVIGAALALLSLGAMMLSERAQRKIPESPDPIVPNGVATVLSVLRSSSVVMGLMRAMPPSRSTTSASQWSG